MKVVIVNCFDTYEERVDLVHDFFKIRGDEVFVIQSDFRHFEKTHRIESKEDFIFIETKAYYKNLSISRLNSHYKFAKDAFKIVEKLKPDLLYTFIPPNSLAKFAANYKDSHKETKLIFDLIDLWPETMPIGKLKSFPLFKIWGNLRDSNLKYADLVITECSYYQSVLGDKLFGVKTETLYLAKREIDIVSKPQLSDDAIHLAYLGSINNIIDVSKIKEIIERFKEIKPVSVHIIGDGERKKEFIEMIKSTDSTALFYGKIFNPQEKQDIFDKCHFGLNIMKDSVCVGLTMKSIDYFQHGLPIINNIPGDTTELVEKHNIGININDKNSMLKKLNIEEIERVSKNRIAVKELFDEKFSLVSFNEELVKILDCF